MQQLLALAANLPNDTPTSSDLLGKNIPFLQSNKPFGGNFFSQNHHLKDLNKIFLNKDHQLKNLNQKQNTPQMSILFGHFLGRKPKNGLESPEAFAYLRSLVRSQTQVTWTREV